MKAILGIILMGLLGVSGTAIANSNENATGCFLEGSVNLQLSGSMSNGFVSGYIGTEWVQLSIYGNQISGNIKNEIVRLTSNYTEGSPVFSVQGWIRSTYVQWNGSANSITGYVNCIPE